MAQIPLPAQVNFPHHIPLPPLPTNPPTNADYFFAVDYVKQIDMAIVAGGISHLAVHQAYSYLSAIDAAINGPAVAPPYFAPALAAGLAAGLAPLHRMISQTHNLAVHDGASIDFYEVPFLNGAFPTQAPHNLPPLRSVADINALLTVDMVAYIHGYHPGVAVPHGRPARIVWIKKAIGCRLQ